MELHFGKRGMLTPEDLYCSKPRFMRGRIGHPGRPCVKARQPDSTPHHWRNTVRFRPTGVLQKPFRMANIKLACQWISDLCFGNEKAPPCWEDEDWEQDSMSKIGASVRVSVMNDKQVSRRGAAVPEVSGIAPSGQDGRGLCAPPVSFQTRARC